MKHSQLIAVACLLLLYPIKSFSQNCFGEFDNAVSTLACVDYEMGFDINQTAAQIKVPDQPVFTTTTNDNFTKAVPSWFMMDHSGKMFNIHQYGFKITNNTDAVIIYKVISKNSKIEIAITIGGSPLYHGVCDISRDENGYYRTAYLKGANDIESIIILDSNSTLVLYSIGSYMGTLRPKSQIAANNE